VLCKQLLELVGGVLDVCQQFFSGDGDHLLLSLKQMVYGKVVSCRMLELPL
jgi:hypothetical protein